MPRPPEYTEQQIVQAGLELEAALLADFERRKADYERQEGEGRRPKTKPRLGKVSGSAIAERMGGGNPARAARIWGDFVAARDGDGVPAGGDVRLPEPLHQQIQVGLDTLYRVIATAHRSLEREVRGSTDGYVADILADNALLRQGHKDMEESNAALEERVAGLEADVAAKNEEVARLRGLLDEAKAERDATVDRLQGDVAEQTRRADDAEERLDEARAVARAAESARMATLGLLRRLGDDIAVVRGHLSEIQADGVAAEVEALSRIAAAAWSVADAEPPQDTPEAAPPAGGRRNRRRRAEPQPEV